ncbi:aminodeoxychorismate synthase component I [Crystallibacter degradans]|uniref:aminodeoxychorismate synthase component I n=1 Tax=Crystallibacter degradans TaxID=2726743 RepID=UPI001472A0E0|nr:aminodeoxychorismate synthase component I [Arthrobacter sp. SF27]NMR29716.1 aminodeoxychorismate synthase component I [Arthrobacter sp. SF27]
MPPTDKPVIIAVDGRSGAGKTTLAVELAALLREHHTVSLFHLEDIYPGWHGLADGQQRYLETVLQPLARGERATWTAWDWEQNDDGERRYTEPAEIVVVEGVGAAHAAARELTDVAIWIQAEAVDRRTRAIARDGAGYESFWDVWAAQEEAWLDGDDVPRAADLLLRGQTGATAAAGVLKALASLPQLDALLSVERSHGVAPLLLTERIDALPDGADLFRALYAASDRAVWLDSSNAGATAVPDRNEYSIMADDAGAFGRYAEHRSGVTSVADGAVTTRIRSPFFRWLDGVWGTPAVTGPVEVPGGFALGWLGYLGYELKRECGGSDVAAATPDAALIFAGRGVVLDHARRCTYLLALASDASRDEARDWFARTRTAVEVAAAGDGSAASGMSAPGPHGMPCSETAGSVPAASGGPAFTVRDSKDQYLLKVRQAQAEIHEGNSYEICLTTELSATAAAGSDPLETYLSLRRRNPAPFANYLHFGSLTVASTSPERFMSLAADGALRAEPIKGTRRRVADPAADAALKAELATSLKDRAENIMIVDLLRNDLSHFAVPGSLRVSRLCAIESYATVHQMVSTIDASLRPDASRAEAIAAAFPAGSMTGAPKISTMDILDRLESGARGVYSGAVGYFSLNGAADLSVVIRTLVRQGDQLTLGVGGAITADSDPEAEWDEVRAKAFGVLSALGSVFPD